MKSTDLRAKARSIFGPAIAEPMPKQPNGAKALQQRANDRPIPTYKVGGPVKKKNGGQTGRNTPEADDVLITTQRGRQMLEEQRRREAEAERKRRAKLDAADKMLGIPEKKDGGKVLTSSDTARALATEMGGMKSGGACMGKPVKKAVGGAGKTRQGMCDKPTKLAKGGAGKVRKGMMTPEGNIINVMNKMRGK